MPVMVKETGFGINPAEVAALKRAGATYVNVAGAGGTNWVQVESYRIGDDAMRDAAREFSDWGLPTALVLAALGRDQTGIVASGGIRSGMDVTKALALGAHAVGMALPFIRALKAGGIEAAIRFTRRVELVLRAAMALTGSRTIADLRRAPLQLSTALRADAEALVSVLADSHEQHTLCEQFDRERVPPATWPALGGHQRRR